MREDLRIFLRYIFDFKEFTKIVGDEFRKLAELKSLAQLSLILSIIFCLGIIFQKVPSGVLQWLGVSFLFVLSLYFRYSIVYKGGEHRRWYRDKKGIPSKKDLIRKEFDMRDGGKTKNI